MEEVVIVGAGIAGLAVAVALKKVGVRALVLERSEGLRATGAAITIAPNAWRALEVLGVLEKLDSIYPPYFGGTVTDVKTKAFQEMQFGDIKRNESGLRTVHRKLLVELLAEQLPADAIHFSCKVTSVETKVHEGSSTSIISLEDGNIIKAKVVIGCDGVHSFIARWLGLSSPVHSGRSGVRGLAVFPHAHHLNRGFHQFVDESKRAAFVPVNDKEVYWVFLCNYLPEDIDIGGGPQLIQRAVVENLAKGFPPLFLDLVSHSDTSTLTWTPLLYRYPWDIIFGKLCRENITVAGDAMHPMTPDWAQGGGAALEDAVVLGRHIGNSISLSQGKVVVTPDVKFALERYAKERRWRGAALVAVSFLAGWVQQEGSSWWRKLLRLLFLRFLIIKFFNFAIRYDCGKLPSVVSNLPARGSAKGEEEKRK